KGYRGSVKREPAPSLIAGYAIMRAQRRRPVALDNAARYEIDQMCVDRTSGGAAQPRLQAGIEPFDDSLDPTDTGPQAVENAGLTFAPMGDEGADELLRLGDGRSVGRPIDRVRTAEKLVQRGHIGRHVAVGRGDNAGRPPHDMVAAEQYSAVGQSEAQMVRGVARRVHRLENPTLAGDPVAVAERLVGGEIPIAPLLDRRVAALSAGVRAEPISRRAGRPLERPRRRRVVAMRVGDQDMRDLLAREAGEQRLDMIGEVRPRVDHRDLAVADDIGPGAAEGKGAGIARHDAPDHRRNRLQPAIFERKLAAERDLAGHGSEITGISRNMLPMSAQDRNVTRRAK